MNKTIWLLAFIACLSYGFSRFMQENHTTALLSTMLHSRPISIQTEKILAGPFVAIAADYHILNVFTLNDQIQHTLPDSNIQAGWHQLAIQLDRSSELDPWFMDTYRLASGLLAYSGYGTKDAIRILNRGAIARTWDWEIPFFAGFISYDALSDNKQALYFFKMATERPSAPTLAIGLASRILQQDQGTEASLTFLRYLLQSMPEKYHDGIQQRIQKLKQHTHTNLETTH